MQINIFKKHLSSKQGIETESATWNPQVTVSVSLYYHTLFSSTSVHWYLKLYLRCVMICFSTNSLCTTHNAPFTCDFKGHVKFGADAKQRECGTMTGTEWPVNSQVRMIGQMVLALIYYDDLAFKHVWSLI